MREGLGEKNGVKFLEEKDGEEAEETMDKGTGRKERGG